MPFEWDLEYLKKFEIAPPTPEQMARSIPVSSLSIHCNHVENFLKSIFCSQAPEVEGVIGRAGQLASDLFEISYIYEKLQDIGDELGVIQAIF